jgi:UDP-N-acetylmuramate--alanine ligase
MARLPLQIGPLHFIGIGGIGMSGIAEVMHNLGYKIQGSDASDSANVKRLRGLGIKVAIGHSAENLGNAGVVVYSSAVKADNPELSAARANLTPTVKRAEMLAELMRLKSAVAIAGTHGKTTTTTMVAALLDAGGFDPTVINGGIINAYGTNARLGQGEWMVVEADESDGTIVKLPATIAVVTNIDPEHLDHYKGFEGLKRALDTFVENIPFYGFAVLCIDHPEVQAMIGRVSDRRLVTYGFGPQADVRAVNVRFEGGVSHYDVLFSDRVKGGQRTLAGLTLPMPGEHNVQNSLAAIAVAKELGIPDISMREALAQFEGVRRRFTRVGVWRGVTIIDDYAHHPVEIAAVMKAARQVTMGRVIAVLQPHRYSRLHDLFYEFSTCLHGADSVVVSDVYAAGEAPIEGMNREALIDSMRAHGHRHVMALASPEDLPKVIAEIARPGDYVVCLGAGSITNWANALPGQLAALSDGVR